MKATNIASQQPVQPSYRVSLIGQLKNVSCWVDNLVGVVSQPVKNPWKYAKGFRYRITVKDPSCALPTAHRKNLLVHIFLRGEDEIPGSVGLGCLVRFARVKMEMWQGLLSGRIFSGHNMHVLSRDCDGSWLAEIGGIGFEHYVGQLGTAVNVQDHNWLNWVLKWWESTGFYSRSLNPRSEYKDARHLANSVSRSRPCVLPTDLPYPLVTIRSVVHAALYCMDALIAGMFTVGDLDSDDCRVTHIWICDGTASGVDLLDDEPKLLSFMNSPHYGIVVRVSVEDSQCSRTLLSCARAASRCTENGAGIVAPLCVRLEALRATATLLDDPDTYSQGMKYSLETSDNARVVPLDRDGSAMKVLQDRILSSVVLDQFVSAGRSASKNQVQAERRKRKRKSRRNRNKKRKMAANENTNNITSHNIDNSAKSSKFNGTPQSAGNHGNRGHRAVVIGRSTTNSRGNNKRCNVAAICRTGGEVSHMTDNVASVDGDGESVVCLSDSILSLCVVSSRRCTDGQSHAESHSENQEAHQHRRRSAERVARSDSRNSHRSSSRSTFFSPDSLFSSSGELPVDVISNSDPAVGIRHADFAANTTDHSCSSGNNFAVDQHLDIANKDSCLYQQYENAKVQRKNSANASTAAVCTFFPSKRVREPPLDHPRFAEGVAENNCIVEEDSEGTISDSDSVILVADLSDIFAVPLVDLVSDTDSEESIVLQCNESSVVQSNGSSVVQSNESSVVQSNGSSVVQSNGSSVVQSNESSVVRRINDIDYRAYRRDVNQRYGGVTCGYRSIVPYSDSSSTDFDSDCSDEPEYRVRWRNISETTTINSVTTTAPVITTVNSVTTTVPVITTVNSVTTTVPVITTVNSVTTTAPVITIVNSVTTTVPVITTVNSVTTTVPVITTVNSVTTTVPVIATVNSVTTTVPVITTVYSTGENSSNHHTDLHLQPSTCSLSDNSISADASMLAKCSRVELRLVKFVTKVAADTTPLRQLCPARDTCGVPFRVRCSLLPACFPTELSVCTRAVCRHCSCVYISSPCSQFPSSACVFDLVSLCRECGSEMTVEPHVELVLKAADVVVDASLSGIHAEQFFGVNFDATDKSNVFTRRVVDILAALSASDCVELQVVSTGQYYIIFNTVALAIYS